MNPGRPFWNGFTAFCTNEATLFAFDKLDVLSVESFWKATIGSFLVGGAVYGKSKVDEFRDNGFH